MTPAGPVDDNTDRLKWQAFRESLREYGWIEGQTITIDWRAWYGQAERLPGAASELVGLPVDVLVCLSAAEVLAAEHATTTIPIVFGQVGGDPVALGLVQSLAHPSGNATGTTQIGIDTVALKALDLLRELVPGLARVAHLVNLSGPANQVGAQLAQAALEQVGIQWLVLDVRTDADVEPAFQSASA